MMKLNNVTLLSRWLHRSLSQIDKAHVSMTMMLRFWSATVLATSLLQAVHGDFSYTAVAYQDSLQYGDVSCLFNSSLVMCRLEKC